MAPERSQQEEEAFQVWCTTGNQNDVQTAEITGIPRSNIGYWRRSGNWLGRWNDIVGPEVDDASRAAKQMMRLATPLIARRLLRIVTGERPMRDLDGKVITDAQGEPVMVDAADDRDAIAAAKLLANYAWGMPAMQSPDELETSVPATYTVQPPPDETPQTVEALKAGVSAMIEATVQSVNTRANPRGKQQRRRV